MPRIETIKASEAPPPPRKTPTSASEIRDGINEFKRNEVLRIQPDPGKSLRGLKTSVGRIASNNKLKLETWTDEAEQYLYVRKAR